MTATDTYIAVDDLIDHYIAMWNEADPAERRALIAETFAPSASYLDPMMQAEGRDSIDAMVAAVQARFPGHRFRRTGKVDQHNDRLRFQWALAPGDGEPLVIGTDFAVLGSDQRLQSVTGFFDLLPAPPA
jgi:hypothetical protein